MAAAAQANGEAQLHLANVPPSLAVGQEMTVSILVESAPLVYGADVRLLFDANLLQVVDANNDLAGVQVQPGDFLDPAHGFELQHHVDNEAGTIDYALALLNPAPPVEGDGLLIEITFRASAVGAATLSLAEGLFGTQTGETVAPTLDAVTVEIVADTSSSNVASGKGTAVTSAPDADTTGEDTAVSPSSLQRTSPSLALMIAGLGVALVIGIVVGSRLGRGCPH